MKIPKKGTTKNPAYCRTAVYHPAVMLSVLNLCSASSVAFWVKTMAVLVSIIVNAMTAQKTHGSSNTFLNSNLLLLSVKVSPVAGSEVFRKRLLAYFVKKKNASLEWRRQQVLSREDAEAELIASRGFATAYDAELLAELGNQLT
jgi:hypothetical protein